MHDSHRAPMQVLTLTIVISLLLAALFVVFFFWAVQRSDGGSLEQESLQPLRDDEFLPESSGNQTDEPAGAE